MNDLISRQAAIDEIDKNRQALLSLGMDGAEHILVHYGRRVIEELPTIEPKMVVEDYCRPRNLMVVAAEDFHQLEKPKHGEWLCGDDMFEYAICSCCEWDSGEPWEYAKEHFRYCPNCGAKMERSEE